VRSPTAFPILPRVAGLAVARESGLATQIPSRRGVSHRSRRHHDDDPHGGLAP
jgi:hypothetical protein